VSELRNHLLQVYTEALEAVNGRRCVKAALQQHELKSPLYVIAIGKAAASMLQGALDFCGDRIAKGLLISKVGYTEADLFPGNIHTIEAGHPWPTAASIEAGQRLLEFISATPADAQLLFLISGGTSSLVEVLPDGVTLDELRRVNDWLLGSGLDIHAMNHVRKAISSIKGGRLARHLGGRPTLALLISDVPGDEPATIGSGLLVPEALLETEAPLELPEWLETLMQRGSPAPLDGDHCYENIAIEIIATLDDAKRAAAQKGRELGYEVYEHGALLGGDAVVVGRQLATELLEGSAGLHVWGGETTVRLPANPGRGGRNQQLALAAAIELEGEEGVTFLAAGTDGTDGPTEDAGALVDGGTIKRGSVEGLDPEQALTDADAGTCLAASGDLIQTGPTGTNVMDLMLGIKLP
jgi:glycerate 2-kinase